VIALEVPGDSLKSEMVGTPQVEDFLDDLRRDLPWWVLGEGSLSRRDKGHRRKMDEALRGEFPEVSGIAGKG
jgi:hypothetical protein